MSDDVLTQIGTGELDVGYYVDATPEPSLSSPRYADLSNSSRPISMRRISLVPAPIS
jgi:hypothetical protein